MDTYQGVICFCRNLRLLRTAHGLSKAEMAEILGVSIRTLTLVERETPPRRLSSGVLLRAADYFRVRTDALLRPMDEWVGADEAALPLGWESLHNA